MELIERVKHGAHGNHSEDSRADLSNFVTEIQEADGQATEDDGEVEPGEEGTFVGKENFGFDAGGEGNALACLVVSSLDCTARIEVSSCLELFEGAAGTTLLSMGSDEGLGVTDLRFEQARQSNACFMECSIRRTTETDERQRK